MIKYDKIYSNCVWKAVHNRTFLKDPRTTLSIPQTEKLIKLYDFEDTLYNVSIERYQMKDASS